MHFRDRNRNLAGILVMSDRGAGGFKDYSEVRSETRIDIWEPLIFGLVFKATGVEAITWEKI